MQEIILKVRYLESLERGLPKSLKVIVNLFGYEKGTLFTLSH